MMSWGGSGMFHAIVPIKALVRAKSRLAAILEPGERRKLAIAMLHDLLNTLQHSPHIDTISLVTSDPALATTAIRHQIQLLADTSRDLNRALTDATLHIPRAAPILIIHADLPLLQPGDLTLFADAFNHGKQLILAESRDGGTNALACANPPPIPFFFGRASLARHLAEARERSITSCCIRTHSLERDIDRPDDVIWLAEQPGTGKAQQYVRELGIRERVACV
jgi:2-phospho-L-lactate/phosphoenolpyruvate guanylyltransferase